MNDKYRSPDPAARILGRNIQLVLSALQLSQQAQALLARHGLPAAPQPGEWYSWQAWLDVLADVEAHYGAETLYAAGLQCINHSLWPPQLHTMHEGLQALDVAYRTNIRGRNLGAYRIEGVGLREVRVVCDTPNPADFEAGVITGVVRKFRPLGAVRVRVERESTPATLKWFRVSW